MQVECNTHIGELESKGDQSGNKRQAQKCVLCFFFNENKNILQEKERIRQNDIHGLL